MHPIIQDNYQSDLERRYAARLNIRLAADEIVAWSYELIRINIGTRTAKSGKKSAIYYTPDFFITFKTHFELHETKGHWRVADKVRFRAAAAKLPHMRFCSVMENGKNNYQIEEI